MSSTKNAFYLFYGILSYLIAVWATVYLMGFLISDIVPKSIDIGTQTPFLESLVVDIGLIAIFGVQHSFMARQKFKQWITKIVPQPIERSTYVLFASLSLMLLIWFWRPIDIVIWDLRESFVGIIFYLIYMMGWIISIGSSFLIDHFDLFGLRQVYSNFKGIKYPPIEFKTPYLYKWVRHPLYLGFLMAFWITPFMTAAHLVFAGGMTVYTLIGIHFEEKDLTTIHGDQYKDYKEKVSMLIPLRSKE